MTTLLALHFLAAGVAPAVVRVLDRRAFWVLALVPAGSFVWLLSRVDEVTTTSEPIRLPVRWVSTIGLDLDLVLTPLSGILALLVTGVGAIVLFYCAWYFKPGDPELWRFSGVLVAFAGSMLGLVLSDNVFGLYIFWELTTVLSYLLIGHNPERQANRRAAMNALIVTTFGGLAMLGGLAVLAHEAGTTSLLGIVEAAPRGPATTVAVLLVLVGAVSKSALVPFHFWLPGAMAAPTPVSAYLHAAAMVKAGIFLIALLAPGFADVPGWRPMLITLGVATMIVGGFTALRQVDAKLLLAHGTISQLGFLTALVGTGTRETAFAGLALLIAHALFKSTLFLLVGIVDRSTGTRDITELSGLAKRLPWVLVAMVLAGASMAGLPPLLGFTAKESALASLVELDEVPQYVATTMTIGVVLGSILTVAYTSRLVWGVFSIKAGRTPTEVVRPSIGFLAGPLVLATACLAGGFLGRWLTPRLATHADAFVPDGHHPTLTLWHGVNLPLVLSAVCIAGGLALFAVTLRGRATSGHLLAEHGFTAIVRAVDRLAVEVTGRTQRGSLPVYLGIILLVLIAVPGTALVLAWSSVDIDLEIADTPFQAVVALIIAVAAILTVRSRRRLRAVLMVGVTGYGTALLFVTHGAPDLALTQVLVETFLLVTFVLVLRRLPPFFSDRPFNASRWVRVAIGATTGLAVAGFALIAASSRSATPISDDFAEPAVEFGGGYNIVNVTLVDIRAWDTLGELSVLVVAATGVASLIFLLTDRSTRPGRAAADESTRRTRSWVRPRQQLSDDRRSVVLEIVTRLLFHIILVVSIYVMLAGHNLPGGGFAGGLIAGLGLVVRYLAGGREELDAAAPVDAGTLLGLGLAVAAVSGLLPTILGGGVLQSATVDLHLPLLGDLHLVTSVFFDIGVYLVVIGLALDVMRSLGGGIDRHKADEVVAS